MSAATQPLLYAITPGDCTGSDDLLAVIGRWVAAGVDLIQIREKHRSGRELFTLCERARVVAAGSRTRLLVNDRWDIALAARLDGVHLPSRGLPPAPLRRQSPPGFLIAQSCHSPQEVEAAEGVDFCVLGPIFATPSKRAFGPPLGIEALQRRFSRPVLALGGITIGNAPACLAAGAQGIAGIRLFADPSRAAAAIRPATSGSGLPRP